MGPVAGGRPAIRADHFLEDPGPQIIETLPPHGRTDHRPGVSGSQPKKGGLVGHIRLVQRKDRRPARRPDLLEHLEDRLDLFLGGRIRRVHDVEQEIGLDDLAQGGAKRGDQVMRELPDEPHGVGEERHLPFGKPVAPGGRVEGGEELVLGEHPGPGERVHERGLARVRVPDQRAAVHAVAARALHFPLAVHLLEPLLQERDLLAHAAAVDFELGFAGASGAYAALLTRQVDPHSGEPREEVLELRQLDLEAGLARAGALGEDGEDQLAAVDHLALELGLQVLHLAGGEIVVEDDEIDLGLDARVP